MSLTQSEKAHRFRELHEQPGTFVIPNPWDVGSARIQQDLASGHWLRRAPLRRRRSGGDGELSREQALAHARMIVDATELPVSADLEKGFGDRPEVVAETVRLAAEAGTRWMHDRRYNWQSSSTSFRNRAGG